MSMPNILKVGDKDVRSIDVTYEDLKILYSQYIETYGDVPVSRYCDGKHNMPHMRIIQSVLKENNIKYTDFLANYGKTTRFSLKMQEEIVENIKSKFPMDVLGVTFYLTDVEVYKKSNNKHNKYVVNIYDEFGYKYKTDYNFVLSSIKNGSQLSRFFKRNPYTYDNINLYCKLNNIDLSIDGTGLPVVGYARELLDFVDSNGNIVKTSWNHITTYKIKCKTQDEVIKFKNKKYMSKEKAIPIIRKMQKDLNRPLLQSDFENTKTTDESIGIRVIWRLWGTFNNMIDELGLIKHDCFYKPNGSNYTPHEDVMNVIKDVCEKVKTTGRHTVMYSDFAEHTDLDITKIRRHCTLDNTTLNDVVKLYGCELQRAGNGMNHRFEDGEFTVSKYEYDFSQFLRENGFEYNKTYFRNIYYKKLDDEYRGNMNCDYCIDFNGQLVYIELAGILGYKREIDAYRNNTQLKSKSKEEYRLKLNQKREMFERNNLEYYILLPDEMNEETYKNILKKYLKEAA